MFPRGRTWKRRDKQRKGGRVNKERLDEIVARLKRVEWVVIATLTVIALRAIVAVVSVL